MNVTCLAPFKGANVTCLAPFKGAYAEISRVYARICRLVGVGDAWRTGRSGGKRHAHARGSGWAVRIAATAVLALGATAMLPASNAQAQGTVSISSTVTELIEDGTAGIFTISLANLNIARDAQVADINIQFGGTENFTVIANTDEREWTNDKYKVTFPANTLKGGFNSGASTGGETFRTNGVGRIRIRTLTTVIGGEGDTTDVQGTPASIPIQVQALAGSAGTGNMVSIIGTVKLRTDSDTQRREVTPDPAATSAFTIIAASASDVTELTGIGVTRTVGGTAESLEETFAAEDLNYTAIVDSGVTSITVTPVAAAGASYAVTVGGIATLTSGGTNAPAVIGLAVGATNTITITVTAGNGDIGAPPYTLNVTRLAAATAAIVGTTGDVASGGGTGTFTVQIRNYNASLSGDDYLAVGLNAGLEIAPTGNVPDGGGRTSGLSGVRAGSGGDGSFHLTLDSSQTIGSGRGSSADGVFFLDSTTANSFFVAVHQSQLSGGEANVVVNFETTANASGDVLAITFLDDNAQAYGDITNAAQPSAAITDSAIANDETTGSVTFTAVPSTVSTLRNATIETAETPVQNFGGSNLTGSIAIDNTTTTLLKIFPTANTAAIFICDNTPAEVTGGRQDGQGSYTHSTFPVSVGANVFTIYVSAESVTAPTTCGAANTAAGLATTTAYTLTITVRPGATARPTQVEIADANETASISSIPSNTIDEGGTSVFSVVLDAPVAAGETVRLPYSFSGADFGTGNDYTYAIDTPTAGTSLADFTCDTADACNSSASTTTSAGPDASSGVNVAFAAGERYKVFTVTALTDTVLESSGETLMFRVDAGIISAGGSTATIAVQTAGDGADIIINDVAATPPASVTVTSTVSAVTEGDSAFNITVALDQPVAAGETVTLPYTFSGTGIATTDFSYTVAGTTTTGLTGNSLVFAATEQSKIIAVSVLDDSTADAGETLKFKLTADDGSGSGYNGVVVEASDEVDITISDPAVAEVLTSADLLSLTVGGTSVPGFAVNTLAYGVTLADGTTDAEIIATPAANAPNADIAITAVALEGGSITVPTCETEDGATNTCEITGIGSGETALATILVTAGNGTTTKEYTIAIGPVYARIIGGGTINQGDTDADAFTIRIRNYSALPNNGFANIRIDTDDSGFGITSPLSDGTFSAEDTFLQRTETANFFMDISANPGPGGATATSRPAFNREGSGSSNGGTSNFRILVPKSLMAAGVGSNTNVNSEDVVVSLMAKAGAATGSTAFNFGATGTAPFIGASDQNYGNVSSAALPRANASGTATVTVAAAAVAGAASVTLVGTSGNIESGGGTASFTLQVRNYTATLGTGDEYLAIGMSAGTGNDVEINDGIPGASGGLSSGLSTLTAGNEDFTIGLGTGQTVGSGLGGTSDGVFLLDAAGDNPNFIVAVHQSLFAAGASSVSTDTDDAAGEEDIVVTLETGCCAVGDDFVASFNGDAQGYGSGINTSGVPTGTVISNSAVTPTARTITFTGVANTDSTLDNARVDDTEVTSFGGANRTGAITINNTSAVELEFWASATSSTVLVCDNSETEVTGTLDGDSGIYTIPAATVSVGDNVFNAHVTAQSGTAPVDCTTAAITAAVATTAYALTVTVSPAAAGTPTATFTRGGDGTLPAGGGTSTYTVALTNIPTTAADGSGTDTAVLGVSVQLSFGGSTNDAAGANPLTALDVRLDSTQASGSVRSRGASGVVTYYLDPADFVSNGNTLTTTLTTKGGADVGELVVVNVDNIVLYNSTDSTGILFGLAAASILTPTPAITIAQGNTADRTFTVGVSVPSYSTITQVPLVFPRGTDIGTVTLPAPVGGVTPFADYALTPALPAGLSFDVSSREITGTPSATFGTTEFTLRATDSNSVTADLTFTITVNTPVSTPSYSGVSQAALVFTTGTAIPTTTLPAAVGGTGTVTYSLAPNLPAGLSFDASSRQITGTPSAALGVTTFTLTATDANSVATELTFNITVNAAVVATPPASVTVTSAKTAVNEGGSAFDITVALDVAVPTGATVTLPYTFSGGGITTGDISYTVAGGAATSDLTGNLVFAATEQSKIIAVSVLDDSTADAGETLKFKLTANDGSGSGYNGVVVEASDEVDIAIIPAPTLSTLQVRVANNDGGAGTEENQAFTPAFRVDDATGATGYTVELSETHITALGTDTGLTPALLNYGAEATTATPVNYVLICRGTTIVSGAALAGVLNIRTGSNRELPGDGGSFDLNVYVITTAFVDTSAPFAPGTVNPRSANANACADVDTASAQSHTTKYTVAVSRASSRARTTNSALSGLAVTGQTLLDADATAAANFAAATPDYSVVLAAGDTTATVVASLSNDPTTGNNRAGVNFCIGNTSVTATGANTITRTAAISGIPAGGATVNIYVAAEVVGVTAGFIAPCHRGDELAATEANITKYTVAINVAPVATGTARLNNDPVQEVRATGGNTVDLPLVLTSIPETVYDGDLLANLTEVTVNIRPGSVAFDPATTRATSIASVGDTSFSVGCVSCSGNDAFYFSDAASGFNVHVPVAALGAASSGARTATVTLRFTLDSGTLAIGDIAFDPSTLQAITYTTAGGAADATSTPAAGSLTLATGTNLFTIHNDGRLSGLTATNGTLSTFGADSLSPSLTLGVGQTSTLIAATPAHSSATTTVTATASPDTGTAVAVSGTCAPGSGAVTACTVSNIDDGDVATITITISGVTDGPSSDVVYTLTATHRADTAISALSGLAVTGQTLLNAGATATAAFAAATPDYSVVLAAGDTTAAVVASLSNDSTTGNNRAAVLFCSADATVGAVTGDRTDTRTAPITVIPAGGATVDIYVTAETVRTTDEAASTEVTCANGDTRASAATTVSKYTVAINVAPVATGSGVIGTAGNIPSVLTGGGTHGTDTLDIVLSNIPAMVYDGSRLVPLTYVDVAFDINAVAGDGTFNDTSSRETDDFALTIINPSNVSFTDLTDTDTVTLRVMSGAISGGGATVTLQAMTQASGATEGSIEFLPAGSSITYGIATGTADPTGPSGDDLTNPNGNAAFTIAPEEMPVFEATPDISATVFTLRTAIGTAGVFTLPKISAATDANVPITYSLTNEAGLPAGVTFSGGAISNGDAPTLNGTPTVLVTTARSFTLNAVDNDGDRARNSDDTGNGVTFTIQVTTGPPSTVTVTTTPASGTIPETGGVADITVELNNPVRTGDLPGTDTSVDIGYTINTGTATLTSDYTVQCGNDAASLGTCDNTFEFTAGQQRKLIRVAAVGDFDLEGDETVILALDNADKTLTNGNTLDVPDDAGATITIDDDDMNPTLVTVTVDPAETENSTASGLVGPSAKIRERDGTATIRVRLDNAVTARAGGTGTGNVTISWTLTAHANIASTAHDDGAVLDSDYGVTGDANSGCTGACTAGGTITIEPGEQEAVFTVSGIDDDVDDEGDQSFVFTVPLGGVSGGLTEPVNSEIIVTLREITVEMAEIMAEVETVATVVGTTQVGLTTGLIQARFSGVAGAPSAGGAALAPTNTAGGATTALHLPDNPQDLGDMLGGLGIEHTAEADGGGAYAVWARGQYSSMEGDPTRGGIKINYDGESTGLGIGAEWTTASSVAGVAVNWLTTDLDLSSDSTSPTLSNYKESLLMVAPYLAIKRPDGRSFWVAAGFGTGEVDATLEMGLGKASADVTTSFLNAGADFVLRENAKSQLIGGLSALATRKTVDRFNFPVAVLPDPIPEMNINTIRARGDLTYHRPVEIGGKVVQPYVGIATLHDGGDRLNDDSHALDLRGGANYQDNELNLNLELSTELLREDHQSWTIAGSARYQFAPGGVGTSLTLDGSRAAESVMGVEGGYGMAMSRVHRDALLTPFAGLRHGSDSGELSSGMRFAIGGDMDADVKASRRFSADEDTLKLSFRQSF